MVDYIRSDRISRSSLSSLILNQKAMGKSTGASIRGAISDKIKAKAVGVVSKFDPLNISRKLLGKTATTILGSAFGRSARNISYFTGDKIDSMGSMSSATPIQGVDNSEATQILKEMFDFMKRNRKSDIKNRKTEELFNEERVNEEQARQEKLVDAIKTFVSVVSTREPVKKQTEDKNDLFEKLKDLFGGVFSTIGKLFGSVLSFMKGAILASLGSLLKTITKIFSLGNIIKGLTSFIGALKWIKNLKWLTGLKWLSGIKDLAMLAGRISIFLFGRAGLPALILSTVAGMIYGVFDEKQLRKKFEEIDDKMRARDEDGTTTVTPQEELLHKELKSRFFPEDPGPENTAGSQSYDEWRNEIDRKREMLANAPAIQKIRTEEFHANQQKAKREALEETNFRRQARGLPPLALPVPINETNKLNEVQKKNNEWKGNPTMVTGKVTPIVNNTTNTSSSDQTISTPASQRDGETILEMCFRDSSFKW